MSYVVKIRTNPGSLITADYECPVHGVLELAVERDAFGDPPATVRCTEIVEICHHCADPPCNDCDNTIQCCVDDAEWRPSPVRGRVKAGEVIQGKVAEYPGDEYVMDTRPLADGMPLHEFKERRAKVHRDIALKRMRQLTGRGGRVSR